MAEPAPRRSGEPILAVRGLHVYYGQSHALQGVDIAIEHHGVLAVVGRNGMGKTTLCKAVMGLVPVAAGSIRFAGEELVGLHPNRIAALGVGYVPQGRRLWPSLTVDEHLRLAERDGRGAWTRARIYETFPRLAERRGHGGAQLSGGEQQMLAIGRALLGNPRLLVMDEPTEGLAPVIVEQVEEMLVHLGDETDIAVLVIEQNIGVATEVSGRVAIMVNGRINRVMDAARLAADRALQQRLLGVGRHGHEDIGGDEAEAARPEPKRRPRNGKVWIANPKIPTRWSPPVSLREAEFAARNLAPRPGAAVNGNRAARLPEPVPTGAAGPVVLVAGTFDTKGAELRFIRDLLKEAGIPVKTVDLSTSGKPSGADIPPHEVAIYHRKGPNAVFTGDRGASVAGMAAAFEAWIRRQQGITGIIAAGGSGGTAIATCGMRQLPIGVPKVMISTVASGDVRGYVGPADIMMMYAVTDVEGLNAISRKVLANGANALAGMVKAQRAEAGRRRPGGERPAIGLTMFGVTTPAVKHVTARLDDAFDCLVFHATGVGGQSMEKLAESGMLAGIVDLTTTEVCDLLLGGVFPASEDRFGAVIRTGLPYVGSCGALDMVNFGPPETVPERYQGRLFYRHNPQVTLMRTTADENARIGRWIGERLNRMDGPVRFFIPEGGVSAIDAPGQPFHDPAADRALFGALAATVTETVNRRLIRLPHHINDPAFAEEVARAFRAIAGKPTGRGARRAAVREAV